MFGRSGGLVPQGDTGPGAIRRAATDDTVGAVGMAGETRPLVDTGDDPGPDLSTCDQEPIHRPGSIQPHGCLLVVDPVMGRIVAASANVGEASGPGWAPGPVAGSMLADRIAGRGGMVGAVSPVASPAVSPGAASAGLPEAQSLRPPIGLPLDRVLAPESADLVRRSARTPDYPHLIDPLPVRSWNNHPWDAVVHRTDQGLIIELWPAAADPGATVGMDPGAAAGPGRAKPGDRHPASRTDPGGVFGRLPFAIGHVARADSLADLCHRAAWTVADLTGFDRVMVYRFTESWDGEVVGEARDATMPSYMGQRFPATDIPAQARALYARNLVRLIPDITYTPVPLMTSRGGDPPLDMTYCNLRSVSPIHLQYLRNMAVRASFSVSLVVDGRLWGLVACHHQMPRPLSLTVIGACQVFAETVAQQVMRLENRTREAHRIRTQDVMDGLRAALDRRSDLGDAVAESLGQIMDLFQAEAAIISVDGRQRAASGPLPGAPVLVEPGLGVRIADHPVPGVHLPPTLRPDFVGQVVIPLSSQGDRDFLVLGRREADRAIAWAGRPDKDVEHTADGALRINPRQSFALWREQVRGHSLPFSALDDEAARTLHLFLSERCSDLRRRQVEQALHESRTRLRDLAECSSDWFWETDSRGRLVTVSDRLGGLGDLHPGELVGRGLPGLLDDGGESGLVGLLPDQQESQTAPLSEARELRRALARGHAFHGLTVPLRLVGRGQWWVRLSGVPRFSPDGLLLGFRGTGTDVSTLKRLQDERTRAQRLESLGRMASGIAHEVNNVLQPVLTMSHYAARRLDDRAFVLSALDDIEKGCLRAREIVRSMLTFACQTPARREPLAIGPALERAIAFAAKGLPRLEVVTDLEETPARVMGNETELSQILINLFSNAADAMGLGDHATGAGGTDSRTGIVARGGVPGGRVWIGLRHLVGVGRVHITIRDEGPGMSRDIQARIFDPFFTTKPEGWGTGMGLAVVHGLVEAWGGSIGVESAPGEGTCFDISLPEIKALAAEHE